MAEVTEWSAHGALHVLHISALEQLGGVRAIFTGRSGGVSARWSGGLNWSVSVGDDAASVRANREQTLATLGLPLSRAVMAQLVHGSRVAAPTGDEPLSDDGLRYRPQCDALITDRRGLALVVTAADCVPVYLYDPTRRVIGLAHAGWRGTAAGMASQTVAAMRERYDCRPAEIHAVIGPSIGPCCYEVDEVVAEPMRRHFGPASAPLLSASRKEGRYMLDLWEANRQDLRRAGLTAVSICGVCTACQVDRFFSHRAESGTAGRGAAVVVLL